MRVNMYGVRVVVHQCLVGNYFNGDTRCPSADRLEYQLIYAPTR